MNLKVKQTFDILTKSKSYVTELVTELGYK